MKAFREWIDAASAAVLLKRRYLPAALVLGAGVGLSVIASTQVGNWERDRLQVDLQNRARDLAADLQKTIDSNLEVLQSIGNFYAASKQVERQEFKTFVQQPLSRYPSIQALEWIPRTRDRDRARYEQAAREEGLTDFQITERAPSGKSIAAKPRPEYFPVYYVEPLQGNERALGFDLASNSERRSALEKARDAAAMVASDRVKLVQETDNQFGFLVFLPIYRNGSPHNSLEERRQNLQGFALGVFRVSALVKTFLKEETLENINFSLSERTAAGEEHFLTFYEASTKKQFSGSEGEAIFKKYIPIDGGLHCPNQTACTQTIKVANREWRLRLLPAPAYMAADKYWRSRATLIGGLVATALAVSYLLRLIDRAARIEAIVRERTAALEGALRELKQTQSQLVQTEKMSSLGQLIAGVAHEINNPVNFIYGNLIHADEYASGLLELVNLYQKYYPEPAGEIQERAEAIDLDFAIEDLPKILSSMKVGADRIRELVRSLRNFSRLDEADIKSVDLHEGIDSTLLILQNRLKPKGKRPAIQVIKEYAELPSVECYAGQLNQVFLNLLVNAIDALEEGHGARGIGHGRENQCAATIRISTESCNAESVRVRIADNGPGMPETVKAKIFEPFFTTKPVGQGTGLGLSISYQIVVEKHGGLLKCISEPGRGTEFWIEIPVRQKRSAVTPARGAVAIAAVTDAA